MSIEAWNNTKVPDDAVSLAATCRIVEGLVPNLTQLVDFLDAVSHSWLADEIGFVRTPRWKGGPAPKRIDAYSLCRVLRFAEEMAKIENPCRDILGPCQSPDISDICETEFAHFIVELLDDALERLVR
jgi:hypothetical protein